MSVDKFLLDHLFQHNERDKSKLRCAAYDFLQSITHFNWGDFDFLKNIFKNSFFLKNQY